MALDTGATLTTLTTQAARRAHAIAELTRLVGQGIGGRTSASFFVAKSIQLGEMHGEEVGMIVSPLNASWEQQNINGLLGTDILSNYDVDLDFPEHKVLLYKVQGICHTAVAALTQPLYPVPMLGKHELLNSGAIIEVSIDGHKLKALIDTGAPNTLLYWDAARRAGLNAANFEHDNHFLAHGIGPNSVEALQHKLAPMDIGDINIRNLPVAIVHQSSPENIDMLLGLDFLTRVHVWLGFGTRTVVMQYPPSPSPPHPVK
jgi:clan AA aspartic protease (TIGR02281 family)